jgi:hypothetical protein
MIKRNSFSYLFFPLTILMLYVITGYLLFLFVSSLGILYGLVSIFRINELNNIIFYIIFLGTLFFQGLTLIYTYLFPITYSQYFGTNYFVHYIFFGLLVTVFIGELFYINYYYQKTRKDYPIHKQ